MTLSQDRLYDLLPLIYRFKDADQGYPLRELLRVIAEQVNLVEEDIAQLYENWFIETAEDWVVPYIGDLVSYQAAFEAGEPGDVDSPAAQIRERIITPRADVANTIRYRRQRGTLAVLELLAQDVSGWPARAVEFYPLLRKSQSVKHVYRQRGQTVDVRQGDTLAEIGSPFDTTARTVDIRRINSQLTRGRYNTPSVGVFVWRLKTLQVPQTPAGFHEEQANCFSFSVLGNDEPLYMNPQQEPDPVTIAGERNLPVALKRRVLNRWQIDNTLKDIYGAETGKSFAIWAIYADRTNTSRGKKQQNPAEQPAPVLIKPEQIRIANLQDWGRYSPPNVQGDNLPMVMVDPELGRIKFPARVGKNKQLVEVQVMYHYAVCTEIGGGAYTRPIYEPTAPITFSQYDLVDEKYGTLVAQLKALAKLESLKMWLSPDDVAALPDQNPTGADIKQLLIVLNALVDTGELIYTDAQDERDFLTAFNLKLRDETYNFWLTLFEQVSPDEQDIRICNRLLLEDFLKPALFWRSAYYRVQRAAVEGGFRSLGAALEQWTTDSPRSAVIEITDSGVYQRDVEIHLGEEQSLQIRAAVGQRPVIIRRDNSLSRLDSLIFQAERGSRLTLDGLLIAGRSMRVQGNAWSEEDEDDAPDARAMKAVTIRHCTLVPGWMPGELLREDCKPLYGEKPSLELFDTGACVTIEHSILGSILISQNEVLTDPILLRLSDTILDATSHELEALSGSYDRFAHAVLSIARSTVIGKVYTHAFDVAENTIFDGTVQVMRRQRGCMRFCWYDPVKARVPRRFNCQPDMVEADLAALYPLQSEQYHEADEQERTRLKPRFTSQRYGNPAYCQLAADCADEIKTGADDRSEMGVYHDLYQPQRATNLRARLDDFVPAGIDAGIIYWS